MSDTTGSGRGAVVVRLLLAGPLGIAAWLLLRWWAYVAHEIRWDCDSGGCGTNDPRALLLIGGIAAGAALVVVLWWIVRVVGFGLAVALCSFAMVRGWRAADGGAAGANADAITLWSSVGLAGICLLALALAFELAATGTVARLCGQLSAPARLSDFEPAKGLRGGGTGLMTFTDRDGQVHSRRLRADPTWFHLPVRAIYPRADPSRSRLAAPWYRPWESATDDSGVTGKAELVQQLERLAALHRAGDLSDAEYERAKAKLLGSAPQT
ncbi:SHOCT domain-containing protein [Nocardia sp. NPDC052566]|uniref:SHOCT domain-containing protein n=1 Tax=Nocardia sp. NPDC052566 TaxID=3364330 RepID=UPI0037CACF75